MSLLCTLIGVYRFLCITFLTRWSVKTHGACTSSILWWSPRVILCSTSPLLHLACPSPAECPRTRRKSIRSTRSQLASPLPPRNQTLLCSCKARPQRSEKVGATNRLGSMPSISLTRPLGPWREHLVIAHPSCCPPLRDRKVRERRRRTAFRINLTHTLRFTCESIFCKFSRDNIATENAFEILQRELLSPQLPQFSKQVLTPLTTPPLLANPQAVGET